MTSLITWVLVLPIILFSLLRAWIYWGRTRLPLRIAFFHPCCGAGGGGERVMWRALATLQSQHPDCEYFVYTGDSFTCSELLERVQRAFEITLTRPICLIHLRCHTLVEARWYPFFTMLGQSLGSIVLALEAFFRGCRPHLLIDTMGYSFTYPVFKIMQTCHVLSYTHYPTISVDMLQHVTSGRQLFNNRSFIANNLCLTRCKQVYYRLFAQIYGIAGRFADCVMVNSSWTKGHIDQLWQIPQRTHLLYPPCDVRAFASLQLDHPNRNRLHILSVAQFRPEKNHRLQLQIFAELLQRLPDRQRARCRLTLVGSVRNQDDENRVNELKKLAKTLQIDQQVDFRLNLEFGQLLKLMQENGVGLHTMVNEHFGIGIVECMAAGLLMVAHESGGPLQDIVQHDQDGFLANECEDYVQVLQRIAAMDEQRVQQIRLAGRTKSKRFSNEQFVLQFLRIVKPFINGEHEWIRTIKI